MTAGERRLLKRAVERAGLGSSGWLLTFAPSRQGKAAALAD